MPVVPSLGRRLACVLYDTLLLLAVWFVAAFPLAPFLRGLDQEIAIPVTQFYLLTVAGLYFTLFWRRGQTLAMKTWGIRMEAAGGALSPGARENEPAADAPRNHPSFACGPGGAAPPGSAFACAKVPRHLWDP